MIENAVSEANRHTARMVRLCPEWVEYADEDVLRAPKKRLRRYNPHTKRWRA